MKKFDQRLLNKMLSWFRGFSLPPACPACEKPMQTSFEGDICNNEACNLFEQVQPRGKR